jgi:hypothetical protein
VTFLWAIPVAAIGVVLAVVLPERPLRESAHIGLDTIADEVSAEVGPVSTLAPESG